MPAALTLAERLARAKDEWARKERWLRTVHADADAAVLRAEHTAQKTEVAARVAAERLQIARASAKDAKARAMHITGAAQLEVLSLERDQARAKIEMQERADYLAQQLEERYQAQPWTRPPPAQGAE